MSESERDFGNYLGYLTATLRIHPDTKVHIYYILRTRQDFDKVLCGDRHRWDDQPHGKVIKASYGNESATITRYDNSELLDTVLEMVHVQDKLEHRFLGLRWLDSEPRSESCIENKKVVIGLLISKEGWAEHPTALGLWNHAPQPISSTDDLLASKEPKRDSFANRAELPRRWTTRTSELSTVTIHSYEEFSTANNTSSSQLSRATITRYITSPENALWAPLNHRLDNDEAFPMPTVPIFNLLGVDIDPAVLQQCVGLLDPDDKDRFQQYFSMIFFSMAVISAPAGSGKSHITDVRACGPEPLRASQACYCLKPPWAGADSPPKEPAYWEKLSQGGPQLRIPMSILRLGSFAILTVGGQLVPLALSELERVEQLDVDRENEDLSNLHTRLQGLADAGPSCPTDEDSSDSSDSEVEITTEKTFEEFAARVQIARKTMTL
ncbi:hypothetical protein FMUND_8844 [Fusarium mundagurra]|uniref:Uncharacterized protein n=1 Tax=Fusarium mundagurra TaxID=1567541 RepID=A0A8H6DBT6_9HYPO|nr:hypothetical protein FMUND_8844 [Fusarium mundagurra]